MMAETQEANKEDVPEPATTEKKEWPFRKARKHALMLSFSGKDYLGMQINNPHPTIEADLWKAMFKAGVVSQDWVDDPPAAHFQRASRTDKGVSAMRMIVSLKMLVSETNRQDTLDEINAHLPSTIRVNEIRRVTKGFNCKNDCDGRTYKYLMPTFALHSVCNLQNPHISTNPDPTPEQVKELNESFKKHEEYRVTDEKVKEMNDLMAKYVGSRFYHNFTSGKLPLEPSAQRFITKFEVVDKFLMKSKSGAELEMCLLEVNGQSFMLHQIRKMIGLCLAIIRGKANPQIVDACWGTQRVDIPRAPGLGLMLDEIHYGSYNKRFEATHETLEWSKSKERVEKFMMDNVYSDIVETEIESKSMLEWLRTLNIHSFEPRHFENLGMDQESKQKQREFTNMKNALKRKAKDEANNSNDILKVSKVNE